MNVQDPKGTQAQSDEAQTETPLRGPTSNLVLFKSFIFLGVCVTGCSNSIIGEKILCLFMPLDTLNRREIYGHLGMRQCKGGTCGQKQMTNLWTVFFF